MGGGGEEMLGQVVAPGSVEDDDLDAVLSAADDASLAGPPRAIRWLASGAWLLPLVVGGGLVLAGLRGSDLPAQLYRTWAFGAHGFLLVDINWYGGHADVGYSVLFPAVAWLVGVQPLTIAASSISTALAGRLVGPSHSWPGAVARIWFGVACLSDVLVGRGPFACAMAFDVAALLAVSRGRPKLAVLAAALASLFSPLAAAFTLLLAVVWAGSIGWRRVIPLAGGVVGLGVAAVVGDGGYFPFPWTALLVQLIIVTVGLVVIPKRYAMFRRGLMLYAVVCLGLFAIPTPVGGNIARLAAMVVGPLSAWVLLRARRRVALAVVGPALIVFQALPVVSSTAWAGDSPASKPDYYNGLLSFMNSHLAVGERLEIPFTRGHWEADYVARDVPLARGWDRQVDVAHNAVLYDGPLSAASYRRWLNANAVQFVALPDTQLDMGGVAEGALLKTPPRWLTPVYRDPHWEVWAVRDPVPIATGVARVIASTATGVTLDASEVGASLVRIRYGRYWEIAEGNGCLAPADDGWMTLLAFAPGPIKLTTDVSLGAQNACTQAQLVEYSAGASGPR